MPPELEHRLHAEVDSGCYENATAVITAALQAFLADPADDRVSTTEATYWRGEIARRRARIAAGEAAWVDGEACL